MSIINASPLIAAGDDGYRIERSLRFNSPDTAYLNRTPASAGNRKTWTWSGWVKRSALGTEQRLFVAYSGDENNTTEVGFDSSNRIVFSNVISGTQGNGFYGITSAVFRDVSAWYHIVYAIDTTQSTAAAALKVYVNGVQQTLGTSTYGGGANHNTFVNNTNVHRIGQTAPPNSGYFNGYLTEVNFIDGQALTSSSFGETNPVTGVWGPKRYAGTYGTNGFYLKFADNSNTTAATLGKDSSGNGNNWTPNNFSVTAGVGNDSFIDVPTPYADGGNGRGNYCTFNAILASAFFGGATLKNGNLQVQGVNGVANTYARGTMAILGKSYAEFFFDVVTSPASIGVVPVSDTAGTGALHSQSTNVSYRAGGNKRVLGTESAYGASWAANDIIGVAVDPTANTIEFFKNGTSQGVITSSAFFAQGNCTFAVGTDDVGSPMGYANFGQRAFAYTPPTGFLALNTQNLPEPSIKKPSSYMDVALFTGTGASQNVTGLNFTPDLVWRKGRSAAESNILVDAVRGASLGLVSNSTGVEVATDSTTAFLSNGFTTIGTNAVTYAAWCWDESATPGFDIVTYTGDGTTGRTVSHNLGVKPSMVIVKTRSGGIENWPVWHTSYPVESYFMRLDATDNLITSLTTRWTAFSSTTITLGNNSETNGSGYTYVAYLWSQVAGFSKFGSYTGNGSADGPFVHCGFRPKWVMFKSTNLASDWMMFDASRDANNVTDLRIDSNSSTQETSDPGYYFDILSNGFKIRGTNGNFNNANSTYIFAAFAESPFKYSLAR
jgi:hypothetical protein